MAQNKVTISSKTQLFPRGLGLTYHASCLMPHHCRPHLSLTSALGVELSASRPASVEPRRSLPMTLIKTWTQILTWIVWRIRLWTEVEGLGQELDNKFNMDSTVTRPKICIFRIKNIHWPVIGCWPDSLTHCKVQPASCQTVRVRVIHNQLNQAKSYHLGQKKTKLSLILTSCPGLLETYNQTSQYYKVLEV